MKTSDFLWKLIDSDYTVKPHDHEFIDIDEYMWNVYNKETGLTCTVTPNDIESKDWKVLKEAIENGTK